MIPGDHAMWIPAGVKHSVEIVGDVFMRSIYIALDAISGVPDYLHVVGLTDLMRCLIIDATSVDSIPEPGSRDALVIDLILKDLHTLPQRPLGLPFPADIRLQKLCREFVTKPSARATIDEWADRMAMSRRSFTRHFQRETGVSLSVWRQQACLLPLSHALPKVKRLQAWRLIWATIAFPPSRQCFAVCWVYLRSSIYLVCRQPTSRATRNCYPDW